MLPQLGTLAVEVTDRRHVVRLEHAAMHDQNLVARGDELLDGGAADEPRPAEDQDPQALALLGAFSFSCYAC